MRRALAVGIDKYRNDKLFRSLSSARDDARRVGRRLRSNGDGTENFGVSTLDEHVTRARLRQAIHEFFAHSDGSDLAFYFSGHGVNGSAGGFLVTSDAEQDDVGIPMQEIVDLGANSGATSIVLLLDCCSAGEMASPGWAPAMLSVLRKNMTVITASLSGQAALESASSGLFTAALLDALDGAAADLLGNISVSGVYAHIERRFGPWQQRPVMKSYMTQPTLLRKVEGTLSAPELQELARLFEDEDDKFKLDPQYDPWVDLEGSPLQETNQHKQAMGRLFKKYRDAGLVRATNRGEDFYWVAQRSGTLELTHIGKEYRKAFRAKDP